MILVGSVGGRCWASSMPTSRPSPATSTSPRRTTWTAAPSSRMRRYSVISAGRGEVGTAHLAEVVSVLGGTPGCRKPLLGAVEPQVDLAGADGVLVLAVLAGAGGAVLFAERPDSEKELSA